MKFLFVIAFAVMLFAGDIEILNQYRQKAGLNRLKINVYLNEAAFNHARYLYYNRMLSHYEKRGYSYFTGVIPSKRALFVGYPSRFVVENISEGQDSFNESVEDLFSAVYHRLGFLNFNVNEIGYAKKGNVFVYDLGNSVIGEYCNKNGARSGYVVCKNKKRLVPGDVFYSVQKENAKVVLWPYDGMKNVPVAFYEEYPDPLPDFKVSGYPVSISFNPSFYKNVKLVSFRLFDQNGEIKNTRILTYKNDINHKLSKNDFVLFPLERLKLNTGYKVVADFLINGNRKTFSWSFFTKRAGAPVIEIEGKNDVFNIKPDVLYIVYFKPLNPDDVITHIRTKYTGVKIEKFAFKDSNSIYLKVKGRGNIEIFANDRDIKFEVKQ